MVFKRKNIEQETLMARETLPPLIANAIEYFHIFFRNAMVLHSTLL